MAFSGGSAELSSFGAAFNGGRSPEGSVLASSQRRDVDILVLMYLLLYPVLEEWLAYNTTRSIAVLLQF